MKINVIIFFLIVTGFVVLAFMSWRRSVKEREEMDEEYRQKILQRAKFKPMSEEEEDYLLKLRAGKKPDQPPGSGGSPDREERRRNEFP